MKVTDWRRKLVASLVAGGLLAPGAIAQAADLNTNLVMNPGFESVDMGIVGDYNAPAVQGWLGGPAFAYSHNPTVTTIPDYADGDDPPNAGSWYFTSNNNPPSATGDWRAPDLVYQDIDVSTGATGSQITIGEAAYKLSAFMSSYLNDNDSGNVQVDFKNSGGTTISSAIISDPDFGPDNVWSQSSSVGLVPVGTASVRVSLFGTPRNSGADGYIDNVDVQLVPAADELLFVEVNTTSGQVAIKNQTGAPVNIDYYEIESAGNALNPTAWTSLQEQNLPGFPAGNGSGNGWEQFGGSSATVIGESTLSGSSSLSNDATVSLGAAFNGGGRDLIFRYGVVAGSSAALTGDYNDNGVVDAADYVVWRKSLNQSENIPNDSTPGTVTPEDYNVWKANFGLSGGEASGPSTLMQGFVRYIAQPVDNLGLAAGAVPETSSILLVGIGVVSIMLAPRRRL